MKRIAAALAAPLLLVALAGCGGGLSDDEQTAADSLAESLNQGGTTDESKAFGDCAGVKIVEEVGLETLKEDGLINDENEVETPSPDQEVSERTAEGMATAIVDCNDWDSQGTNIKADENLEVTDEKVDEFVACMKEISDEDYRQLVIRQISSNEHGDEDAAEKAETAVTECQTALQAD